MKKLLFLFTILLACALPSFASAEESQTVIDFNGELIDQNAAPLSGVLPLEFRIFANDKAKKPIATEKHFVSVVDGAYFVSLGESAPIKSTAETLFVAVYLDGKELTRQQVSTQLQLVATNPKIVKTDAAGSDNGDTFSLECPAGYVVTGIEGSTKNGIQGIRLICSKAIQL